MRLDVDLTEDNFNTFAVYSYTNLRCQDVVEFNDDLLRIKYLRRLLRKYIQDGYIEDKRVRLALNHTIILFNVFKGSSVVRMLFHRCEPVLWPALKSILSHLNLLPAIIHKVNGVDILTKSIEMDKLLSETLERI